ncbi:MAG: DUF1592 domain-containing protein [Planctomycetota bacterium]
MMFSLILLLALAPDDEITPLVEGYCYPCHSSEKARGDVDLETLLIAEDAPAGFEQWAKVARVLTEQRMPPERRAQPTDEERGRLISWIEGRLAAVAAERPGRTLVRRLSRREYTHSVRDLLGVSLPDSIEFPADGSGGEGFDNNADTLFVPPLLMERYLEAAGTIADEAPLASVSRDDAHAWIRELARRAYRWPDIDEDAARLIALYDSKAESSHLGALRLVTRAVLVSPRFLFRIEHEGLDADAPELASRLSYFLWCTTPDEELMSLAASGALRRRDVLDSQVDRLIADPRLMDFADDFSLQWLGLTSLRTTTRPNGRMFPSYTDSLRESMIAEAAALFAAVMRGEGTLLDLIDSEFAYVNEELAAHYGLSGVSGEGLRRVVLPDKRRGGVLGLGAVQTVTSYSRRTSPVLRGKWVLETMLGSGTPPPPSNAKSLPEDDRPKEGQTFRQRLEEHRKNPECASCHQRMDPLGFGLENFDAIGRWRDEIGGIPIDATGTLEDGQSFEGPIALKRILMEKREVFCQVLTRRLIGYARGRGVEAHEEPLVRAIASRVAEQGYSGPSLLRGIAQTFLPESSSE